MKNPKNMNISATAMDNTISTPEYVLMRFVIVPSIFATPNSYNLNPIMPIPMRGEIYFAIPPNKDPNANRNDKRNINININPFKKFVRLRCWEI